MGSSLIFQFLYTNVLNYYYFHNDSSTFLKIKKVGKIKNAKKRVFYRKIKKNVYKRLSQLWETVRDRGIVTMEDEYKVVCALSNCVVFDDLE